MFFTSNEKKLFAAIRKNNIERIAELLDEVDPNFFRKGVNPLMYAAKQGNVKAIEKIIQKGGKPSILDADNRTPLMHAAYSGNSKVVDILTIAAPEIISYRDKEGLSAANYAYIKGYKEIVNEMEDNGYENRLPLHTLDRLKEVNVKGAGENIQNIDLDLENNTSDRKSGIVLPGTVFHSNDDSQDMVCTEEFDFELESNGSFKSKIPVACIDGEKPIPRSHNNFSGATYDDAKLIRIINEMKGKNPHSIQAAVWAYENHYTGEKIMNKLRSGEARRTVINRENIEEAQEVLDKLGIKRTL